MVLSTPTADAGAPPDALSGFERIERTLRLVDGGAIVAVHAPWMGTLRDAVARLRLIDPELAVCERLDEFRAAVRPGRLIIWHLQLADAPAANLYRDVIRAERLEVVVWTHPAEVSDVRDAAPDLFDWMRTEVRLPSPPPAMLLTALRSARRAPGIIWWGPGSSEAFAAALPDVKLWPLPVSDDYRSMLRGLQGVPRDDWVVWVDVTSDADIRRVRWVHAEVGRARAVIDNPPLDALCHGWWPLGSGLRLSWAIDRLTDAGFSQPTLAAAACGNRPHWVRGLIRRGAALGDGDAVVARLLAGGAEAVALLGQPSEGPLHPFVGGGGAAEVGAVRRLCRRVDGLIRRGRWPESDALGIRVSRLTGRAKGVVSALLRLRPKTPEQVAWQLEASLRLGLEPWRGWRAAAAHALQMPSAAAHWETAEPAIPDGIRRALESIEAMAELAALGRRWAATVRSKSVTEAAPVLSQMLVAFDRVEDMDGPGRFIRDVVAELMHRTAAEGGEGGPPSIFAALDAVLPRGPDCTTPQSVGRLVLDHVMPGDLTLPERLSGVAAGLARLQVAPEIAAALEGTARLLLEGAGSELTLESFAAVMLLWAGVWEGMGLGVSALRPLADAMVTGSWSPNHTLTVRRSMATFPASYRATALGNLSQLLASIGLHGPAADLRHIAVQEALEAGAGQLPEAVDMVLAAVRGSEHDRVALIRKSGITAADPAATPEALALARGMLALAERDRAALGRLLADPDVPPRIAALFMVAFEQARSLPTE